MAELFKRAGVNASQLTRSQQRQVPNSPSLDSDILSNSAIPSSVAEFDGDGSGWVIFSPQIPVNELHDPLEHIEPLDLSKSNSTVISPPQEEHGLDASLQIPFHNGEGNFQNQSGSRLDLFERVNAWRMEQSAILDEDLGASSPRPSLQRQGTVWQKLKQNSVWGLGRYLAWDDEALDALFNKDYGIRQRQQDQRNSESHRSTHLSRARMHGPPFWEDRIQQHTLYRDRPNGKTNPGLLVAILSRSLLWSRSLDLFAERQRDNRNSLRGSPSPLHAVVHPEHSYHLDVIQRSIATLSSTIAGAPWSDTWDTGTSTSLGVAAA